MASAFSITYFHINFLHFQYMTDIQQICRCRYVPKVCLTGAGQSEAVPVRLVFALRHRRVHPGLRLLPDHPDRPEHRQAGRS